MTVPTITGISPINGPTSGGDIVRVIGTDFAAHLAVFFGATPAETLAVRNDGNISIADVRTPAHQEEATDVLLRNLDIDGNPVPDEEAVIVAAYRFLRPRLTRESNLTRLVRTLLRELKGQVIANTSITVSVDYGDISYDGMSAIAISQFPALVLSGPRVIENRFYASNELHEQMIMGASGPEIVRQRPAFTVDLEFTITAASNRIVELFNILEAVATFLHRNPWIEMPQSGDDPDSETVRLEMEHVGEYRTNLDGPDDIRVFTGSFVIRGFDIDEGMPVDIGHEVTNIEIDAIRR